MGDKKKNVSLLKQSTEVGKIVKKRKHLVCDSQKFLFSNWINTDILAKPNVNKRINF